MKSILIILFIGIALNGHCQNPLNITIIGTAHYFDDEHKSLQNFEKAKNFIIDLNPDIICIEAIPTYDTLSMREIWPSTMAKADQLRDTLEYLDYTGRLLQGAEYYTHYDLWNAYYQWFQVQQVGDSLGYLHQFQRKLGNSEYGLLVFPAAQALGVSRLYGIDYRVGERDFLTNNSKVLKSLLFKLKWKPLRTYIGTQKKYKKANEAGLLMEYINGDEFQQSFSALIDNIPTRLKKSEAAKDVKAYWAQRNQVMADRVIEAARAQGASSVLLTVGSAHVTHIRRSLESRGHQVATYGEYLSKSY